MLTRSGLCLPELGLGCATLANDYSPKGITAARSTLAEAKDTGITYFDTAPFYGVGLSERLVGDAVRDNNKIIISSKVGRILVADGSVTSGLQFRVEYDYSYDGIMRSYEHSQQRMGCAKIDILFAHDLGSETHGSNDAEQFKTFIDGGGYRAMRELRDSGEVQAIGLGVNETEICLRAMRYGEIDVFLLAGRYTLLERSGAEELFVECEKSDTDIIIGGPFNSGMLVGGNTYNYKAIPEDMQIRYNELCRLCEAHSVEIGAAAMQFPLRSPIVKSVIPGPKTPDELDQICKWADASIPDEFWADLAGG